MLHRLLKAAAQLASREIGEQGPERRAGSARLRRRQRAADPNQSCPDGLPIFVRSLVKPGGRVESGGIGQVSTGPLIWSGSALLRSVRLKSSRRPHRPRDVEGPFRKASDRKMLSLRASAPNRKCTNSTKLVLPAPLRDWRSLAPSLLSASRMFRPCLKVRVLNEAKVAAEPGKS